MIFVADCNTFRLFDEENVKHLNLINIYRYEKKSHS